MRIINLVQYFLVGSLDHEWFPHLDFHVGIHKEIHFRRKLALKADLLVSLGIQS